MSDQNYKEDGDRLSFKFDELKIKQESNPSNKETTENGLIGAILRNIDSLNHGSERFEQIAEHFRRQPNQLKPQDFDISVVRNLVEYILRDKFGSRFSNSPYKEEWLGWLVDQLIDYPQSKLRIQRLWSAICQQNPSLPN